jgi:hypothetical protein
MIEMSTAEQKRSAIEWSFIIGALAATVVFLLLLFPSVGRGPSSPRTQCKNNLKQLALALHNYHERYQCFPPAYIANAKGMPMHSWRVLILPFIEQTIIYEQYRFDEPWNGPNNRKLDYPIATFHCQADPKGNQSETSYVAVVGPDTMFPGDKSTKFDDCKDGPANTILLVEIDNSGIDWKEPRDIAFDDALRGLNRKGQPSLSSPHEGGAHAGLVEGSVRFPENSISAETLRKLLNRNDGPPSVEF